MTLVDIQSLLPDPDKDSYEKLKKEHPYNILSRYGKAIAEKYPGKLEGILVETTDASSTNLIGYAFYIMAAIGKGYSYKLMEVAPISGEMYPLEITLLEKYPQKIATVGNPVELEEAMNRIIRMGFTQTLLTNLLAQVELYNESRN